MSTYLICPRVHIKKKNKKIRTCFKFSAKLTRSFIEGASLAHSSPNRFLKTAFLLTGVYCIHSFDTNSLRPHKFITRGPD